VQKLGAPKGTEKAGDTRVQKEEESPTASPPGVEVESVDSRHDNHRILPYLAKFTPDSNLLVTASTDGSAHVWEIPSGRHVAGFFGHTRKITCLDISPDGKWCVTGSADGTTQVWNLRTGVELMTLPLGSEVTAIAFDPRGERIATAAGGIARIWPLQLLPLAISRAPRELTSAERLRYEVTN
jgi:WD40 repeat protein